MDLIAESYVPDQKESSKIQTPVSKADQFKTEAENCPNEKQLSSDSEEFYQSPRKRRDQRLSQDALIVPAMPEFTAADEVKKRVIKAEQKTLRFEKFL